MVTDILGSDFSQLFSLNETVNDNDKGKCVKYAKGNNENNTLI